MSRPERHWHCSVHLIGVKKAAVVKGAIAPVPRISTKSGPFSPGLVRCQFVFSRNPVSVRLFGQE